MSDPREQLRHRLQEPSNDARQRLRERLAEKESGGAGEALSESFFNRFVSNILAAPSASGDLLAAGAAAVEGVASKATGGEFAFGRRYAEQQEQFPASAIRSIPRPTMQDLEAGGAALRASLPGGEAPGEAFDRRRRELEAEDAARREAQPFASGAGDVAGDVATLITGRAPIANLVRRAEQRLAGRADIFFGTPAQGLKPGAMRFADRALGSPAVRNLARGAGRSVETGLEAAVLEVLKGDDADPLEAAAFASGGQMVGSVLLEGGKGILSGGPLKAGAKISITAASIAGLWQLGKEATPGGRDRILESIETGYSKVAYGLMLGAAAAMSGAPRYRSGKMAEDFPKMLDAMATVPRGLSLSIITDMAKMDEAELAKAEKALNGLSRDPDYEGRDEIERRIIERIRSMEAEDDS